MRTSDGGSGREMPRYRCNTEVWALKIERITYPESRIHPVEAGYVSFVVPKEYIDQYNPQPGGYYVVYPGGYKSYSPAGPFEAGYTLISVRTDQTQDAEKAMTDLVEGEVVAFLNELTDLSHKYGIGIAGKPVLVFMEAPDVSMEYDTSEHSDLIWS